MLQVIQQLVQRQVQTALKARKQHCAAQANSTRTGYVLSQKRLPSQMLNVALAKCRIQIEPEQCFTIQCKDNAALSVIGIPIVALSGRVRVPPCDSGVTARIYSVRSGIWLNGGEQPVRMADSARSAIWLGEVGVEGAGAHQAGGPGVWTPNYSYGFSSISNRFQYFQKFSKGYTVIPVSAPTALSNEYSIPVVKL